MNYNKIPVWQIRKRRKELIKKAIAHFFLLIGAAIFIFPYLWLVSTSLKPDEELFTFPPSLIPHPVIWNNYPRMLTFLPFTRFFFNTSYVTFMTLAGVLISCSLVAYGFSRLRFPGRDILFVILLSTMMLPYQVTMVPLYITFKMLGWIDTYKPLWVPAFFAWPFYVFLLRQFFLTIPYELEDAAKIDGCSYFGIYWRIMLPLIKPAIATVAIFTFMGAWNDFIGPLIYLNTTQKLTLALGLQFFRTLYSGEWSLMMAAATFMTFPVVLLFFFTQKYFIQGIVLSGLKA